MSLVPLFPDSHGGVENSGSASLELARALFDEKMVTLRN